MKQYARLAELETLVGQTLGTSDWLTVDQKRIDTFAQATGDDQWIHVDAERAAAGPVGKTIARGAVGSLSAICSTVASSVSPRKGCTPVVST